MPYLKHLLATASLIAATPAFAQEAVPADASSPTTDAVAPPGDQNASEPDEGGLQDIVVTAQKRAENLQRVPITVTAFSSAQLAASGVSSTLQLNTLSPGLNIRVTNGSFQPTIRGIGTSAGYAENPVSLYIDGVYIAQQSSGVRELNDIAQVTVLKGPQGTLFGRNSTAGVIQITTKAPSHDFHAEVGASIDDYETLRSDLYVTGGLTDTIAASLSAQYNTQGEGWGHNFTTSNGTHQLRRSVSVRGKLLFELDPRTKVTLIGEYGNNETRGGARVPYSGTSFSYPGFGPVSSEYDSYADNDGRIVNNDRYGSATIDHDFGFARLLSISAYHGRNGSVTFDNDGVASPLFLVNIPRTPSSTYTQEIQLVSSGSGRFKWVMGAFFIDNRDALAPSLSYVRPPFVPVVSTIRRDSKQTTRSVAGFAQGTWEFLPGTNLTGGVRYTYEKRDFRATQTVTRGTSAPVATPVDSSLAVDRPTFRLALDHQFTPAVLGYVSFNTGFKSGGFNLLAPLSPAYQPETLRAYEAGMKMQLLDRKVRFNVSGFYYDYTNIQISQIINNLSTVSNGAKARLYGADVDIEAALTSALRLSGGFELLHATFLDYPGAQIARINPAGGAIITSGSVAGNRIPLSQKFSGNASINYERMVLGSQANLNLTATYNGDYYFEPDNFLKQDAYVLVNSTLGVTLPGGNMTVSLWGKNLLNKIVITQTNAAPTGFATVYDLAPRTIGASARFRF